VAVVDEGEGVLGPSIAVTENHEFIRHALIIPTTVEPALLKRVQNFSFRGCIRRPTGDPPGPTIPPYAARRRFARRLSDHSGR
jgi:hypothetical protein